jgi:hypothetical protein
LNSFKRMNALYDTVVCKLKVPHKKRMREINVGKDDVINLFHFHTLNL